MKDLPTLDQSAGRNTQGGKLLPNPCAFWQHHLCKPLYKSKFFFPSLSISILSLSLSLSLSFPSPVFLYSVIVKSIMLLFSLLIVYLSVSLSLSLSSRELTP